MFLTNCFGDKPQAGRVPMEAKTMEVSHLIFFPKMPFIRSATKRGKSFPHFHHLDSEILQQMSSTNWNGDFLGLLLEIFPDLAAQVRELPVEWAPQILDQGHEVECG